MSCTEFVIQDKQQAKVLRDRAVLARIDTLFGVRVVVAAARHAHGEWLSVRGPPENAEKAKRYVLALCTPEFWAEARSQGRFSQLLFGENSRLRDDLEREYQTVVKPSPSGIRVQGGEISVGLTVSRLVSLMETMDNGENVPEYRHAGGHHPQQTHTGRNASNAVSQQQPSLDLNQELLGVIQQIGSDDVPSSIEKLTDSVKLALLEGLKTQAQESRSGGGSPPLPVVSRDCGQSAVHEVNPGSERKLDYFLQLGYPREKIEAVLVSLGPAATENAILARLVRVSRPPLADAHRSQKLNISRPRRDNGEPLLTTPIPARDPSSLRPVVIDGSNVAMRHGNGHVFSCKGILLAVEWFRKRSHKQITVFVPSWRKEPSSPESPIMDQEILYKLEEEGCLVFTPSRRIGNKRIVCYDDRFILHLAAITEGVIVSNDNYRDLIDENQKWRVAIEQRLLMFLFAGDNFMVPEDPLGRYGPRLEEVLQMDHRTTQTRGASPEKPQVRVCPYADRCTFGRKCRFYHPEREPKEPSSGSRTPSRSTTPTPPERRVKEDARLTQAMGSAEDVRLEYSAPKPEIDVHGHERLNPASGPIGTIEPHPPPPHYLSHGTTTAAHPRPPFLNLTPPAEQFTHSVSNLELPSGGIAPLDGVSNPYSITYPLANLHHSSAVRHTRGVTEELYTISTSTHQSVPSQLPPKSRLPPDVEQRAMYLSRDSHSAGVAGQTHLPRDPHPVAITPVRHHPSREPSPRPHGEYISRDCEPVSSSNGSRQYTSLSDQQGYRGNHMSYQGFPQQHAPYYNQPSYQSRRAEMSMHGRLPYRDHQQPYQIPQQGFTRDYSPSPSSHAVPPTVGPQPSMGYACNTPTNPHPYSSTEHVYSRDGSGLLPDQSAYPLTPYPHTLNPHTCPPQPPLAGRRASVCDHSRNNSHLYSSRRASLRDLQQVERYQNDKKLFDQLTVVLPGCDERIRRVMREHPEVTELVKLVELVRSLD